MAANDDGDADRARGFFEGRFLIAIEAWSATLSLRVGAPEPPEADRFQGRLSYGRGFELRGQVLSPRRWRGRAIHVRISPFGPQQQFGPDENEIDEVGRIHFDGEQSPPANLAASLMIPEDAVTFAATCLGSTWKYLQIAPFGGDTEQALIDWFSFERTLHERILARIDEE